MFDEFDSYIDDYIINGFILADDKESGNSFLAYGLFHVGINKNYLAHYNVEFDNKNFYVLTDSFAVGMLMKDPENCCIKETYELDSLSENEKTFYLKNDSSHQIYKDLFYSVFPDCEPHFDIDLQ